jgi:hypothetical protein
MLLALLALSALASARPGPAAGGPCRLAVLSIGVNDYSGYRALRAAYAGDLNGGRLMSLGSAVLDAQRFARHLATTWRCGGEPKVVVLTDEDATGPNVVTQLRALQQTPADYVVIYVASHGGPLGPADAASAPDFVLPLYPTRDCRDAATLADLVRKECALTGRRIKSLLDQLQARRQLLVMDAGIGGLGSLFLAGLAERNPLAAALAGQSRAIISTRGPAPESPAGGLLTTTLLDSTLAAAIRDDLSAEPKGALDRLLGARLERLESNGARFGPTVYYERDLLPLLSSMQASIENLPSRGTGTAGPPPSAATPRPLGLGNYALIVGTSEFDAANQWRHLANPVPDAAALDSVLRSRYGFKTILLTNPTKREFQLGIKALRERIGSDSASQVLIFVAGHGLYDETSGSGALVHRDSKATAEDEFLDTYTTFPFFASMANALGSRHVLVMLDVCFGGLFSGQLGSAGHRGDEQVYAGLSAQEYAARALGYRTRQYLTSGGKEYVPDGRPGYHSPFASRLLELLRRGATSGRYVSLVQLRAAVEDLNPQPRAGGFGEDEPGSDIVLLPAR